MQNIRKREGKKGVSYQARTWANGKAKAKSFKTLAEAQRWLALENFDQKVKFENHIGGTELTIGDCIRRYRDTTKEKWARAKERALCVFEDEFGDILVSDFTDQRLLAWAEMRSRDVGPSTLQSDISYFNVMWQRSVSRYKQRGDINMVKKVSKWLREDKLIGPSNQRERRPSEDELTALREYWRGSNTLEMPMVDMMDFTLITGVRVSELCRLRWEDFVDGPEPRIRIRDRKDPKKKTGNHMWLPLIGGSAEILRRQPRTDERLFPFVAASVAHRMWVTCKALGIEELSWHCFRHEAISRLFERGWTVASVAQVSGHKTWSNLQRYTHLSPSSVHSLPY